MNGLKQIIDFIKKIDFEFGSKNIDDDFHTDYLFYKVSCDDIEKYIGIKHNNLISIYNGYTSYFYYPKSQTCNICKKLINDLINNNDFYNSFIDNYIKSCESLSSFWDSNENESSILEIYKNQYDLQINMYIHCWPTEILQTENGIEYEIKKLLLQDGLSEEKIKEVLYDFENAEYSVYALECLELKAISKKIQADGNLLKLFSKPTKYLQMNIPYDMRKDIMVIYDKYKYIYYHGFSNRNLPTFYDYLEKIKKVLFESFVPEKKNLPNLTFRKDINKLLYIYSKLSYLKSFRRLAQLKNFYFLDKLILNISDKYKIPESYIRFMMPSEVIKLLEEDTLPLNIEDREKGMVYIYQQGKEKIFSKIEINRVLQNLNFNCTENSHFDGKIACKGQCEGKVKKIIRAEEAQSLTNQEIILTCEGDPDLIPYLNKVRGIICEQAGITCHMAVVARELKIPCITGVGSNVMDKFRDGDLIFLNADEGYFERRSK